MATLELPYARKEYQSWHCRSDVESQSTIVWHEDKRGKAADNGDLDLAAAVWQQCGSSSGLLTVESGG